MAELGRRPQEFLVYLRGQQDLSLAGASPVFDEVGGLTGVRKVETIRSSSLTLASAGPNQTNTTIVVTADTPEREDELQRRSYQPGHALITPNLLLQHHVGGPVQMMEMAPRALAPISIRLLILDPNGGGIPNVLVKTYGTNTTQAVSDVAGRVTLTFFTGSTAGVEQIYIKPAKDFWEKWIINPALTDNATITLQPLQAWQAAQFSPQAPYATWTQAMLGLDVNNNALTGAGIRIAVADSGCDTTHPLAQRFQRGMNYADRTSPNSWNTDSIGHGTWCETLIAGFDPATGRRGFAPQAEMHTLKIFPGGSLASLQQSLIYCIDNNIDVLSLSLGTPKPDPGTSSFIQEALQAGVAIFAAAGNSYGPVSFPASEPGVFAVAAIGQAGRFPPDTYHAQTQSQQTKPGTTGINGLFAPDFTGSGPAIQGCAPGVAVISGAPGNGFAAEDGTSMACPQMAGLAALALAHHPQLRGQLRSPARTAALYQILRNASRITGLNPDFSGAGIPNIEGLFNQPAPQGLEDIADVIRRTLARAGLDAVNTAAAQPARPFVDSQSRTAPTPR